MDAESNTNDLHDALLRKNNTEFWKWWQSKFECSSKCSEVEGCVDPEVIASKFAAPFSKSYSCNNSQRMKSLSEEYTKLCESYYGLPLTTELKFNTELVSTVISQLHCGKAPDIDGITAEHL